jgi:predicted nucleic acid-binding Zn ribbon protein
VQSIQQFSSGVIAEIIRRQPASKEKTSFAWQLAVGPALARVSNVDLRDRVLFVTARDDRWRKEIARAVPAILAKMQHLLGSDSIQKIRT